MQTVRMRELGYFAVVTGRESKDETITDIEAREEQFFLHSKRFRDGALKRSQVITANLTKSVSKQFWKMVKENVDQQADVFKERRFILEKQTGRLAVITCDL